MRSFNAICVLLMVIIFTLQTQRHGVQAERDLTDSKAAPFLGERLKRSLPRLIASVINSAILRGKSGQSFFSYNKYGGYTRAREDFFTLTGKLIPTRITKGKSPLITEKLDKAGGEGFVTLYKEGAGNAFIVINQGKITREIAYITK